ncbi:MAG: RNA-binding transcriptional accessory protein [Nitrospinae bacterium]|nr:RNA-binding transcriptional accessory protein [Nitrospinota bacterium]
MAVSEEQLPRILVYIVEEAGLKPFQVQNTAALLLDGGTVPFIARYRKEQTGELDEVQVRNIEELLAYFQELQERKATVLKSVEEQGKLTPELKARVEAVRKKTELEDLYLPFKPKRRTKATIARERGLEPLADLMAAQELRSGTPEEAALPYVNPEKEVPDEAAALEGACYILAERLSEDADVRAFARRLTQEKGIFRTKVASGKEGEATKFQMYYDYKEPVREIPSHRMLAMRRGENEEVLVLSIDAPEEEILDGLKGRLILGKSIFESLLEKVAEDSYKRLLAPSIAVEVRLDSKKSADETAIRVFSENLKNLLLQPPAGSKRTLGIDPGLRTGSKLAAVDETGRFLEHVTIYPHTGGDGQKEKAKKELLRLLDRHSIELIAIGNGTAGREMEQFARETLREAGRQVLTLMVNEAGASVYSASPIAREEFPDLDLTVRGAISIARRSQDPLAELVKIDPKSIGVGQYQHDVNQNLLKKGLDSVVESCVNYVGVELNTASYALLSYVAGVSDALAKAIVHFRDANGPFPSRQALLKVPRFGPKAYEQAAGFLRIRAGEFPLDNTGVHPERYGLVESMARDLSATVEQLAANASLLETIDLKRYITDQVGLPTLTDIIEELKKPGRDPRKEFQAAVFREDITKIDDLKDGLILQGTVTNVTAFGAFVDVGVHQDGLVHISHLANRYVKDPADVVKVGQVVKVKVLSVDKGRNRVSLSIKEADPKGGEGGKKPAPAARPRPEKSPKPVSDKLKDVSAWEKAGFRVR